MNDKAKIIIQSYIIPAVVAVIVVFLSGLVGNQLATLGATGITRFPNSGIAARGGYFGTSMPASVTDGTLTVIGISTFATGTFSGTIGITGTSTFTGLSTFTGGITASGDLRFDTPVDSGTITALTSGTTVSVSAANVCDSGILTFAPTLINATATLPTAATMWADCLTTNGDFTEVIFRNTTATAATTTILTAAASTTLVQNSTSTTNGSSAILNGGEDAILKFIRVSATAMYVFITKFVAAP